MDLPSRHPPRHLAPVCKIAARVFKVLACRVGAGPPTGDLRIPALMPLGPAPATARLGPIATGLRQAAGGFAAEELVRLGAHGVLRLR